MRMLTKIAGAFFIVFGWLCPFAGAGEAKAPPDAKVTEDSPIYLRHGAADPGRSLDMNMRANAKSDEATPQHWNHYSGHCSGHCNHWSHHSHCNGW